MPTHDTGSQNAVEDPTLDALLAALPIAADARVLTGPRLGDPMHLTVPELRQMVRWAELADDPCPGWRIIGDRLVDEDGAVVVEPFDY